MADDVVLGKVAAIERCLGRIREEYADTPSNFFDDITRQDAILLNLQRACQATIDLSAYLVRLHGLGVPQQSREAFTFLADAGYLSEDLSDRLKRMVGFRNVAVHTYKDLDLDVVHAIVTRHLADFQEFARLVLRTDGFRRAR